MKGMQVESVKALLLIGRGEFPLPTPLRLKRRCSQAMGGRRFRGQVTPKLSLEHQVWGWGSNVRSGRTRRMQQDREPRESAD